MGDPVIFHAVTSLNIGGAERLVVDLAQLQRRLGSSVTIVNLGSEEDDLVAEARSSGIDVVGRRRAVLRLLKASRHSALHIHSPWCLRPLAPVLPLFAGAIVYTRHGAHAYASMSWKLLHGWAHRFIDHLTFVSDEARTVHQHCYGATRLPHHLLEFGISESAARKREPQPDCLRIGNVGRLVALKGQSSIIDAAARIADAPIALHFFGEGPERERLRQQAAAVMPGRVTFHGSVSERERIYGAIDILVVASRMEGLSLVIMEAMMRQIPVIATDVGGNRRLVISNSTGILVPYGDIDEISRALIRLIADPKFRTELGAAGRAHVIRDFSLDKAAQQLQSLYGFARLDAKRP